MLRVIRVRHVVPTSTSVIRFEPAYYTKLLDAAHRHTLPDPGIPIDVGPLPEHAKSLRVMEFASVDEEIVRIDAEFRFAKTHAGRGVVEAAYPADTLRQAIMAEVEAAERMLAAEDAAAEDEPLSADLEALEVKGLGTDRKRRLQVAGLTSNLALASVTDEALAKLPGISLTLARSIIAAAKLKVPMAARAVVSGVADLPVAPTAPSFHRTNTLRPGESG